MALLIVQVLQIAGQLKLGTIGALPFLLPPVRESAFDQLRRLNARDHFEAPTAAPRSVCRQRHSIFSSRRGRQ